MKKLLLTLMFLTVANSAFAWGDFERGIATGIGGVWLYNRLNQPTVIVQQTQPNYTVLPAPNPTIYANPNYQPRPYWCRTVPVQDTLGRTVAFQQVCD
jgi:hypothetical protein